MIQPITKPSELTWSPVENSNKVAANSSLFGQMLMDGIQSMNETQTVSKTMMADVLMGRSENTHGALIELEKAELQMNLATVVRDKTVQAYNQMINMQI